MIINENISDNGITIWTKNRSFLSLDKWGYEPFKDLFKNDRDLDVYWFTRITVLEQHRNKGEGTLLLRRICSIADNENFIIVLGINAYGDLNTEQLRRWYAKHGWHTIIGNMMLRLPNEKSTLRE